MTADIDQGTVCGFATIIGATNAGKSTLLNRLVGSKIAIVTHKVQTTRTLLRGVAIRDHAQVIFVDTPGLFEPKRKLDRAMVDAAWGGTAEADLVILLIDAAQWTPANKKASAQIDEIIATLKSKELNVIAVLNKIDQLKKEELLRMTGALGEAEVFREIFMVSALNGDGVDELFDYVVSQMPSGPWLYPEDQAADVPLRLLASEITREKLFLRLHQELPYASTVETDSWEDRKDGSVRIEQTIFVERDSQKAIVLGKGGRTIKAIGAEARKEISEALGRKVHLFLFAKVRSRWGDDPERYKMMGLDYPQE